MADDVSNRDLARIGVTVEANFKRYEKQLQKIQQDTTKRFDRIERSLTDSERSFDRFDRRSSKALTNFSRHADKAAGIVKSFGKGLVGGLIGGLAIGSFDAAITRMRETTREVANIGNEAKRAGVSVKAFQELKFVADQNRINVDALVDGLKELNLRADEFSFTGKGPAAEAFQRLGFGAAELKRKLQDPSTLLVEIIRRMEKLNKAAQIRVADEIFGGTAGERFVELMDRGADGIETMIRDANELGLVLDEDLIKRADEIDRKFDAISKTVGTKVKGAIVNAATALTDFIDQFNRIEEQNNRNITDRLRQIYDKRDSVAKALEAAKARAANSPFGAGGGAEIKLLEKQLSDLADEAMRLRDILDRRQGYDPNFKYTANEARDAAGGVDTLNEALNSSAPKTGADKLESYADAIRALKNEIPGLTAELSRLDAEARINGAYKAALGKARTIGDTYQAEILRNQAMKALDISTAKSGATDYLSGRLASGRSATHVSGLNSGFASALAEMMASAPEAVRAATTINSGFRSVQRQAELFKAAVEKYGSVAAARKWVAPPGKSQHNDGQAADLGFATEEARRWFHANAGKHGLTFPMQHEPWHIESADARRSRNDQAALARYEEGEKQAETYREMIAQSQEFIAAQEMERQALGLTANQAAAIRYEQELFNEAQRAGIELTPEQRSEIAATAQAMADAEMRTQDFAQAQADAQDRMAEWQNFTGGAIKSFISDLRNGKSAAEAFSSVLEKIADKLIDMALDKAMSGIFNPSAAPGSGGGFFASLLKVFGFADGGYTGAGRRDEPAGIVHRGEVVWSQQDVERAGGVSTVEAMRKGQMTANGLSIGRAIDTLGERSEALYDSAMGGVSAASRSQTVAPIVNNIIKTAPGMVATTEPDGTTNIDYDAQVARMIAKRGSKTNRQLRAMGASTPIKRFG